MRVDRGGRGRAPHHAQRPTRGRARPPWPSGSPTILPDLTLEQSLEVTAVHSLVGALDSGLVHAAAVLPAPPRRQPCEHPRRRHRRVRPGEVSRAHHGVLFLDEFPLFRADVIDALRQPLEAGEVTIARREESATYPARAMVVLAANPCPCGNSTRGPRASTCNCLAPVLRATTAQAEGPIVDRIDIWRDAASRCRAERGRDRFARRWTSAERPRRRRRRPVAPGRALCRAGLALNAACPDRCCAEQWPLAGRGQRLLDEARPTAAADPARSDPRAPGGAGPWPTCGARPVPDVEEVEVALRLRTGDPLDARGHRSAPRERAEHERLARVRLSHASRARATRGWPTW